MAWDNYIFDSAKESNDCCREILKCNISFYLRVPGNNWLHYTGRAVPRPEIFNVDRHRDSLMIYRQPDDDSRDKQRQSLRTRCVKAQPRLIALMNTVLIRDDELNPGELGR